jgi:hypothetical protein
MAAFTFRAEKGPIQVTLNENESVKFSKLAFLKAIKGLEQA